MGQAATAGTLNPHDLPVLARIGDVDEANPDFDRFEWERDVLSSGVLKRLSGSAVKLMFSLASHASGHGLAWPGMDRLIEQTGLSDRSIRRASSELVEAGVVRRCPTTNKPRRLALALPSEREPGLFDGTPAPEPAPKVDATQKERVRSLMRWLETIMWRDRHRPEQRIKAILRNPDHALRCRDRYAAKAREIAAAGGTIRQPAALFEQIFKGEVRPASEPAPENPLVTLRKIQQRADR